MEFLRDENGNEYIEYTATALMADIRQDTTQDGLLITYDRPTDTFLSVPSVDCLYHVDGTIFTGSLTEDQKDFLQNNACSILRIDDTQKALHDDIRKRATLDKPKEKALKPYTIRNLVHCCVPSYIIGYNGKTKRYYYMYTDGRMISKKEVLKVVSEYVGLWYGTTTEYIDLPEDAYTIE